MRFTYPARRRRPAHEALRGVDVTIARGEAVALLGPNGSGKSTFMRIACGLLRAESGTIEVLGRADDRSRRRALGVVFQAPALDRHQTILENLRDQSALYGIPARDARRRIDAALERADLASRAKDLVRTLSGGLARRADLCRALLHEPDVLLLDEPTTGLDPAAREAFLADLETRRRDDGLSILMTTHLVDEAQRHDRVVLMDAGAVVADAPPAALCAELGELRLTITDPAWTPPDPNAWSRTSLGWTSAHDHVDYAQLAADLARANVPFALAPPTLADVFEAYTGRALDDEEPAP